jgi:hypothetical protein
MRRMFVTSVVALSLAGCQTGVEYQAGIDASLNARLEAYNGRSVAEFMGRTGLLPISTYDVSEGRIFVFRTDPVYLTLPATNVTPAVTRSGQCQLLIRAVPTERGQGADQWKIMGTQRTGPCNNLPV